MTALMWALTNGHSHSVCARRHDVRARRRARAQVEWLLTVHDHYAADVTGPDGQNDNNLTC